MSSVEGTPKPHLKSKTQQDSRRAPKIACHHVEDTILPAPTVPKTYLNGRDTNLVQDTEASTPTVVSTERDERGHELYHAMHDLFLQTDLQDAPSDLKRISNSVSIIKQTAYADEMSPTFTLVASIAQRLGRVLSQMPSEDGGSYQEKLARQVGAKDSVGIVETCGTVAETFSVKGG